MEGGSGETIEITFDVGTGLATVADLRLNTTTTTFDMHCVEMSME